MGGVEVADGGVAADDGQGRIPAHNLARIHGDGRGLGGAAGVAGAHIFQVKVCQVQAADGGVAIDDGRGGEESDGGGVHNDGGLPGGTGGVRGAHVFQVHVRLAVVADRRPTVHDGQGRSVADVAGRVDGDGHAPDEVGGRRRRERDEQEHRFQ